MSVGTGQTLKQNRPVTWSILLHGVAACVCKSHASRTCSAKWEGLYAQGHRRYEVADDRRWSPFSAPSGGEASFEEIILDIWVAAQQVVRFSVCIPSRLAHQSIQSDDPRDPRMQRMRLLKCRLRTATAPADPSSRTARTVELTRCSGLEPRGYSEEEKDWVYRAYRERGSKRAVSRIFGISRCCIDSLAQKKGRESGSVAEGVRTAEEGDVLELDECWTYVRKRSNKRWLWVALCRRTRQVVANAHGDRSARTCARLWSRIPEEYYQAKSFSDFWKSYRPVFEEDPTHQQVGKSSGELAHVERFFGRLRQKLAGSY